MGYLITSYNLRYFVLFSLVLLVQTANSMFLFERYPGIENIPYQQLGDFPTPIIRLSGLEQHCGRTSQVYMKHDGLSGALLDNGERLFGGNKVRKLEFLLADAQSKKL